MSLTHSHETAPSTSVWPLPPENGQGFKVLFVNPPTIPYNMVVKALGNRGIPLVQQVAMPMGILYLASVLERDLPGIEVRIVDLAKACKEYGDDPDRPELTLEELTDRALTKALGTDFVPDFVGISILFSTAHRSTTHIAEALKRRWPSSPIIVGGMHATNAVETLLAMPAVDYVCRGEAEKIISTFAKAMRAKGDGEAFPGVYGRAKLERAKAARQKLEESAPMVDNIDDIPYPAWHLIPMNEYVYGENNQVRDLNAITQDGEATIMTTRGCPFSCTFCSSWTVHGRSMRYRSVDNVLGELDILHDRYGVTMVIPEDDLFTVKKTRIITLCDAVTARFGGKLHFQFPNGLSVATLDEDVIRSMVRMGMELANIAIESGSEYVQKHVIKKNCDLKRARRVIQACRDAGIYVRAYFILGFPGETRAQIQESIDYAASLPADWISYNIAAPLIGTEMYEQLLERKDIDSTFNWDDAFYGERAYDTAEIGAQDLKDMAYAANIANNFFGNYNLMNGLYDRAIKLYTNILKLYPGHLAAQYCIGLAYEKMGDTKKHLESIEACHQMLAPGKDPLARTLFEKFGAYFPQLAPPWEGLRAPEMSLAGPRPGMPYRARQLEPRADQPASTEPL